jgi:hypothetical protein
MSGGMVQWILRTGRVWRVLSRARRPLSLGLQVANFPYTLVTLGLLTIPMSRGNRKRVWWLLFPSFRDPVYSRPSVPSGVTVAFFDPGFERIWLIREHRRWDVPRWTRVIDTLGRKSTVLVSAYQDVFIIWLDNPSNTCLPFGIKVTKFR